MSTSGIENTAKPVPDLREQTSGRVGPSHETELPSSLAGSVGLLQSFPVRVAVGKAWGAVRPIWNRAGGAAQGRESASLLILYLPGSAGSGEVSGNVFSIATRVVIKIEV